MARNVVAEIRRVTWRKFTADDKIRIVLKGLRGKISVSQLCRQEVYVVRRNGSSEMQN